MYIRPTTHRKVHLGKRDGSDQRGEADAGNADRSEDDAAGQTAPAVGHFHPRHPQILAGRVGRRHVTFLYASSAAANGASGVVARAVPTRRRLPRHRASH